MKLTNEQLIQLIKEELEAALNQEEQIEEVFGRGEVVDSELENMSLQQLKNKKAELIGDQKTDTIIYKKVEKLINSKTQGK